MRFAVIHSLPLLVAFFVAGGIGTQAFDVIKMAAMRKQIPEHLHGRAFSADFFFSFAALPVGQVIGATALKFVSPNDLLLWCGGLVIITTALVASLPSLRQFDEMIESGVRQGRKNRLSAAISAHTKP